MEITLVGFMGTGKSTIGELLAQKLNLKFIETDNRIEKTVNKNISEIFSEEGENIFRKMESDVLENIINLENDFVLSTGGGIVIKPENRKLIKENTIPILLEASPDIILKRTKTDSNRPLLNTYYPLKKIKQLMMKRNDYYNKFPDKIYTDNKNPGEIVQEIIRIIGVDYD